jgi:hypothetical protein
MSAPRRPEAPEGCSESNISTYSGRPIRAPQEGLSQDFDKRAMTAGDKKALEDAVNDNKGRTAIALGRQKSLAFLHFSEFK